MSDKMSMRTISIFLCAVLLHLGGGCMDWCYPDDSQKNPVEVPADRKPETVALPVAPVPGSNDKIKDDPGIDLVVSKVEMTRGVFEGERMIRITPYVKNMWKGRTSARIKILLDGLALAEWIEGGIGPGEEKRGGGLCLRDATGSTTLNFSVEVDDGNEIPENNEDNNRCENITLGASQTHEIWECPIEGPHGPEQ